MTEQIDKHLTANGRLRKRDIMAANFLGGLSWGFGTVVGATVVVALLFGILRTVNLIPVVGGFISGVVDVVQQNGQVPAYLRK